MVEGSKLPCRSLTFFVGAGARLRGFGWDDGFAFDMLSAYFSRRLCQMNLGLAFNHPSGLRACAGIGRVGTPKGAGVGLGLGNNCISHTNALDQYPARPIDMRVLQVFIQ